MKKLSSLRESFNKKDTADSTAEMAVQIRPSRSILKNLLVNSVPASEVKELIITQHYLHSMPATASATFGVYWKKNLVGAAVFTPGPRNGYLLLSAAKPQDVATLARFYLQDSLPKNSESRVLGIILRLLRKMKSWKFLLSYADPAFGHIGTIYKASGWLYLGKTEANGYIALDKNRLVHPRTVYRWFGTNSVKELQEFGISAKHSYCPGKHRYGYFLDSSWQWRLHCLMQSYPRKEEENHENTERL